MARLGLFQVSEDQDRQHGHYCLTSTVMLALTTADQTSGPFSLSGSITRQVNHRACFCEVAAVV